MSALDLHESSGRLTRMRCPDGIVHIHCTDGIYIVYEVGERFGDMDRIVRIGTHDKAGRLKLRLEQHFRHENMESSIFRKNIGRALSGQMEPPRSLETAVTRNMRANFSFVAFEVKCCCARLRLEKGIIATLHNDPHFKPSEGWLGLNSPKQQIRESGLWNVRGLDAPTLSPDEMRHLQESVENGDCGLIGPTQLCFQ